MSRRLDRSKAVLVVIDFQEKFAPVIHEFESVERNIERLIRGSAILDLPRIVTEQYVKGLGKTTTLLRAALGESNSYEPIEKNCFSSCGSADFRGALASSERRQILLCGVEAHVCVYQTALDLLDQGFEVTLIADAVSSRSERNRDIALRRLEREGAKLSSTEMALFELLVEIGTDEFREISRLVK
jgi:nicotinamidase-related amidase